MVVRQSVFNQQMAPDPRYEASKGDFMAQMGGMYPPAHQGYELAPPMFFISPNTSTYGADSRSIDEAKRMRGILDSYGAGPDVNLGIIPSQDGMPGAFAGVDPNGSKNVMIFGGSERGMHPNELQFMVAHELNHLKQNHDARGRAIDSELARNPMTQSGQTFKPYTEKNFEREADLMGQRDYLRAGGDPGLFTRPGGAVDSKFSVNPDTGQQRGNLDPRDPHYNAEARSGYLMSGLMSWLTSKGNAEMVTGMMNSNVGPMSGGAYYGGPQFGGPSMGMGPMGGE